MRIKHPSSRGRAARLLAAAAGMVVGTFALSTSAAASPQEYSSSQLSAVSNAVQQSGVEGIAWYVDDASHRVVVTADSTVSGTEIAKIRQGAGGNAGAVGVQRAAGVFAPLLSGGDAIYGGGYRCSLGFNVVSGATYYFLTAGHCGNLADTWYTNASHTSLTHPGGYAAADAYVGEPVKRTGSTTGTHSGTVTALNVKVRYVGRGGGVVSGMIQTNVCAEPGDSGGPLYDGSKALGITSGGSGDCKTGGTTFYQPVPEAANAYGVTVY